MVLVTDLVFAVITLFVIIDPVLSLAPFLALTKKFSAAERQATANRAVYVAGALAVVFLLAGPFLMEAIGISLASFKVAGGIVLGLLGLEMVLDLSISRDHGRVDSKGIAVLIATPLLTGPGLLTALVVLVEQSGLELALSALAVALFASWLILRCAVLLQKSLGSSVLQVISRVMGLLLMAIAVEFVKSGFPGV
ncbi:hypothetical protein AUJ14_00165 [Candidatus Micrarchaeota archaeon CG1_02_55_22]|nr:MAG: hypothetical protein AUJ14_00165 [Candidatus Micrarchaeota archaeon CG1_02_55_22]